MLPQLPFHVVVLGHRVETRLSGDERRAASDDERRNLETLHSAPFSRNGRRFYFAFSSSHSTSFAKTIAFIISTGHSVTSAPLRFALEYEIERRIRLPNAEHHFESICSFYCSGGKKRRKWEFSVSLRFGCRKNRKPNAEAKIINKKTIWPKFG